MSSKKVVKRIGRPPGADADRTRAAILDAALEAFADRGFDGASIREITGAAGVGHNLVRHYFGSKEDLWRATVHHALDDAASRVSEVLQADSEVGADETMRAGIEVLLSGAEINPAAVRLLVLEGLRGGARFDEIFDELLASVGTVFTDFFRREAESLADVDPRVLAVFVFGAIFGSVSLDGMLQRLGLVRDGEADPILAQDLQKLVLNGLLAGD